jgi:FkbM family methyltransferase
MTEHEKMHQKWEADGMREKMYEHPYLNSNSVVMEIGAFRGLWLKEIFRRYQPYIYAFEPIKEFYWEASNNVSPKILVFNYGLGASDCSLDIQVNEDATGIACKNGVRLQTICIRSIHDVMVEKGMPSVDLAQINCEGGEYDLLWYLCRSKLIALFDHLQIQFHELNSSSKMQMEKIFRMLGETHRMHYDYPFIFTHWSRL